MFNTSLCQCDNSLRVAFVSGYIRCCCKSFSLSSLTVHSHSRDCECLPYLARPTWMMCMYTGQPKTVYKTTEVGQEVWWEQGALAGLHACVLLWWLDLPTTVRVSTTWRTVMGIPLLRCLNSILQFLYLSKCNNAFCCVIVSLCITHITTHKPEIPCNITYLFKKVNLILSSTPSMGEILNFVRDCCILTLMLRFPFFFCNEQHS